MRNQPESNRCKRHDKIIRTYTKEYLKAAHRNTSNINRKRIAVHFTNCMLEANAFEELSDDINYQMFLAMQYEYFLYEALKKTQLSCEVIPEEERFKNIKLISEGFNFTSSICFDLVANTLERIEEVIKDESARNIRFLSSRK